MSQCMAEPLHASWIQLYDGLLMETQLQEYHKDFNAVDSDGDGHITFSELEKVFVSINAARREMSE